MNHLEEANKWQDKAVDALANANHNRTVGKIEKHKIYSMHATYYETRATNHLLRVLIEELQKKEDS